MGPKDDDQAIEYFKKVVETQGIAVSTVADGIVLMVTKSKLQELLSLSEGKGNVILFIKKPGNEVLN